MSEKPVTKAKTPSASLKKAVASAFSEDEKMRIVSEIEKAAHKYASKELGYKENDDELAGYATKGDIHELIEQACVEVCRKVVGI